MDEQLKKNISAVSIWIRLAYMVLFAVILYGAYMVLFVTVLVQFLFALITGTPNTKLFRFSDILCQYIRQCIEFESFLTEEKPFPFSDLPESDIVAEQDVSSETVEAVSDTESTPDDTDSAVNKSA